MQQNPDQDEKPEADAEPAAEAPVASSADVGDPTMAGSRADATPADDLADQSSDAGPPSEPEPAASMMASRPPEPPRGAGSPQMEMSDSEIAALMAGAIAPAPVGELSDAEIAALLGGGGGPPPEAELSDAQIAALLGGGADGGSGGRTKPVEQVLADSVVSQISAAMLTHISEKLRSRLTISLRNHTSDNVELSDLTEILRYGEYVNRVPLPVMIGVAEAREWMAPLMVLFDGALIYGLMELLMGGRKNHVSRPDQRQFTAIEQRMVERTIQIVLDDLSASLSGASEINFSLKHLEVNPRFAGLARDSEVVVLLRYKVQIERRSGCIDIVLPRRTLEPVREQLASRFSGGLGTNDARWEERMRTQLSTTPVEVVGVLPTRRLPLSEVLAWRVGTVLPLEATPETPVHVVYGGMEAWRGLMGRKAGQVAVCLDQKVMGEA